MKNRNLSSAALETAEAAAVTTTTTAVKTATEQP